VTQDVFTENLVVEQVETVSGLRLRLTIQLSLKAPDPSRVCRLLPITFTSPLPGFNRCMTVRLPPIPPPEATLRPLPSHQSGLPRLPEPSFRRAEPATPADQAGAHVDCFPRSCSLPQMAGGSASAPSFSRPAQASLTLRPIGSLSRPKATFVTRLQPVRLLAQALVSHRINRQLSVWNLPPLTIAPSGRTARTGLLQHSKIGCQ
jgi:hypothetical protein